jgi:hypothetical protein
MRWKMFKNNVGARLKLRPIPLISIRDKLSDWEDVHWIVANVNDIGKTVELSSVGYEYVLTLGKDHICSYMTDRPGSDGIHYGFIKLHVQLVIDGYNIKIEPL